MAVLLQQLKWTKTGWEGAKRKVNKFGSSHIVPQIQVIERYSCGDI